jgi:hypothetical protein
VARSWATGTNWSTAAAAQRVYEFAVEPTVLQHLPEQALLVAAPGRTGPDLQAVECDPAIVTLPGVSTRPLGPVRVSVQISLSRNPWEEHRPRRGRLRPIA